MGGADGWLRRELDREYQEIRQSMIDDPNRVCVLNGTFERCPIEQFEAAIGYARDFARERAAFVNASIQAAGWNQDSRVPDLEPGKVVNAASGAPFLAPGELVFVEATLPLHQVERAGAWPLPLEIAGVWANISGFRARMVAVSPAGAWIQTPADLPCGPAAITLFNSLGGSHTTAVEIRPAAPGIYAVTHADGAMVDESLPAAGDEVVVVWATGLGHAVIDPPSGQPAPTDRLVQTRNPVAATVDGKPVPVLWAGLAPGYAGLYQVVIHLPKDVASGSVPELALMMFGEPGVGVSLFVW
jgi:uncharacterized protein (TIGR03437 family)